MSEVVTVERTVHIDRRKRGRKELADGPGPVSLPPGRVPRVARLMALAIRMEQMIAKGTVKDYAQLAQLGKVSRARITQIMNLLCLAPDLQEQLLFLPKVERGRERLRLADLQPIASLLRWDEQRRRWRQHLETRRGKCC